MSEADPIRLHGQAALGAVRPYMADSGQMYQALRELLNTAKPTQENLSDIKPDQLFALFTSALTNKLEHTLAGGTVLNNVQQAISHTSETALTTFESTVRGIDMLDAITDWRVPRESVPLPMAAPAIPVKRKQQQQHHKERSSEAPPAAPPPVTPRQPPPPVQSSGMATLLGRLAAKKN